MFKRGVLFLMAILTSCVSGSQARENISFDEFDSLIQKNNIVVIDIRTPSEVSDTGIIGSVVVKNYFDSDFEKFVSKLDKSNEYIIHCKSGGRSGKSMAIFKKHGVKVYNFSPGINGWIKKGRKLVKNN